MKSRFPGFHSALRAMFVISDPKLSVNIMGLTFRNRIGLAAGLDKDARLVDTFANLGFGFIEIGTLTPLPQPGNEVPRLFRLPKDQALINRMGFNNSGVNDAVVRLKNRRENVIIGGNIGKNKSTPNERASDDYIKCFNALYDHVDYFVVNVSSPNTPGLRELQDKAPLTRLLSSIKELSLSKPKRKPVLLKIAPDLTNYQLDDIIEIIKLTRIDGVVATNTTIDRSGLSTPPELISAIGAGGLSGRPLAKRSNEVIRYLRSGLGKDFPIIGVGGVMTPDDAMAKLEAGADLVQIYTGFIYEGPSLIRRINKKLLRSKFTADKMTA